MNGTIFNIQKFSIHDGPGIRTTVFFKDVHIVFNVYMNVLIMLLMKGYISMNQNVLPVYIV